MKLSSLLCIALLATSACGGRTSRTITVNGIEVYPEYWHRAVEEVRPRATLELGCAPNLLEFALLQRTGRIVTALAIRGCGKVGFYNRVGYGAWFLSSMQSDTPVPAPESSPASVPGSAPFASDQT